MKNQRFTKKDKEGLWGENGPYSEVNLSEQARILDDTISRIFLVVEAKINPFTFEFVLKHRKKFTDDEAIQQLLDHAEFRGCDGYVVFAGEEELIDKKSFEVAFKYRATAVENILKMHDFVIQELGLSSYKEKEMNIKMSDKIVAGKKYIWDSARGSVVPADESIWSPDAYVDSPAGIKNSKIRYFVVLALVSDDFLTKDEVIFSAAATKKATDQFQIDIENAETNKGYIMLTVLIGVDIAPADFIEQCIAVSNVEKKLFMEDYYITNVSRPTWQEIQSFLRSLRKRPSKKK